MNKFEKPYNKYKIESNNENEIKIGAKNPNSYVIYAIHKFLNNSNTINILARGQHCSKAIVVSMILKENYFKNLIMDIDIGSVLLDNNFVPTMSIKLTKEA